jgi:hypothetical protein
MGELLQRCALTDPANQKTIDPAATRLTIRLLSSILLVILLIGCVAVSAVAFHRAEENRACINRITLGQTTAEVAAIMGHGPERRDARLRFDGKKIEMWSYATDYVHKTDTTVTFVDDRVTEIRATSWEEKD